MVPFSPTQGSGGYGAPGSVQNREAKEEPVFLFPIASGR